MEPRYLPIKIFSKRGSEDLRETEGGGGNPPEWVLEGDALTAKAASLRRQLDDLGSLTDSRDSGDDVPVVAAVTVKQEALAKSHRSDIGQLFSETGRGADSLIGMERDLTLLVALDGARAVSQAAQRFDSADRYAKGISAVEDIQLYEPSIEYPQEDDVSIKVKLIRFGAPELDARVAQRFEARLRDAEVPFERRRYAFGLDVYKVPSASPSVRDAVEGFAALHSVAPMPRAGVRLDTIGSTSLSVTRKEPVEGVTYVTVGVLDSGIEPIDHLRPWLDPRSYTPYVNEDLDRAHGTATASVLLYGDEMSEESWIGAEKFRLLDAAVFPGDLRSLDEDDLVANIQEAVTRFTDVKIWMLAGGWSTECGDREFSDFAKALDDLQKRLDIVIVTSAGNCDNFRSGGLPGRITASADSLMAVTVGSAVHEQPHIGYEHPDHRSPFSRVGPGPNRVVKPDLVHYGGNATVGLGATGELVGVPVMTPSGGQALLPGTSFSTPRVAALAAGLAQSIDEDASPLLLRALMLHSARYGPCLSLDDEARLRELGYGVPRSVQDVLYNSTADSTLVLEDRIEKGQFIELFDFPFPPSLVDQDGYYRGEILATLVVSPRFNSREGAEYCQSDIEIKMGTYDQITPRDTTKQTVKNPFGRRGAGNVLLKSNYTRSPRSRVDAFTPERTLRDGRFKYHPVKKYAVNLSEMTPARREEYLRSPKRWFVELRGTYTSAAEAAADDEAEVLYQDFCLVVTVRDPLGAAPVYDETARALAAMNFPHHDVRVRSDVRVRVV